MNSRQYQNPVKVGDIFSHKMPFSEVCMFLKIAGVECDVYFTQSHPIAKATVYDKREKGKPIPMEMLASEAGIYQDNNDGNFYIVLEN